MTASGKLLMLKLYYLPKINKSSSSLNRHVQKISLKMISNEGVEISFI